MKKYIFKLVYNVQLTFHYSILLTTKLKHFRFCELSLDWNRKAGEGRNGVSPRHGRNKLPKGAEKGRTRRNPPPGNGKNKIKDGEPLKGDGKQRTKRSCKFELINFSTQTTTDVDRTEREPYYS